MEKDVEKKYIIEKSIWTQNDYEKMGWHDCNIYGFAIEKNEDGFTANLIFDIDYIFEWINPIAPEQYFSFRVAPCTLIFEKAFDVEMDLKTSGAEFDLMEIADLFLKNKIEEENNKFVYEWIIELQQGQISLKSYGFEQIVRQEPAFINKQILNFEKRGGVSFDRKSFDNITSSP
jgi:hypothetical protein